MNDTSNRRSRAACWAGAAGVLIAGAGGGRGLMGAASASAATDTAAPSSGYSSSASTTGDGGQPARASYPAYGTAAHEALEKPVTGSSASQAQAAAVRAVGEGTAGAVTTDVSGN